MSDKPAETMLEGPAGIDCDTAELFISRKVDGELSAADNRQLQDHLRTCVKCSCRLESWIHQSRQITGELDGLWPQGNGGGSATLPPLHLPRYAIFPLSLAASQVTACAGLVFYCLFFNLTEHAPVHAPFPVPIQLPAELQASEKTQPPELPSPAVMNFERNQNPDTPEQQACDGRASKI